MTPGLHLFWVGDAFLTKEGTSVVLGGVSPELALDAPVAFTSLLGAQIELRIREGSSFKLVIRDTKATVSISGAYNFFVLVDHAFDVDNVRGAEVVLLHLPRAQT